MAIINKDSSQSAWLSDVLTADGWKVRAFTRMDTALNNMSKNPCPALVIAGLHMPGVDGWRFCRLLRSSEYAVFNAVPILVVSSLLAGDEPGRLSFEAGADAFLTLPVSPAKLIKTVRRLTQSKTLATRRKMHVLVVEDEIDVSGVLQSVLKRGQYDVRAVVTLSDALKAVSETEFDLAVIDYHLPDGKGDYLLDALRKKRDCICIMFTGDPSPELALKWMRQGAAAYLRKPFKPDYLLAVCSRALRERSFLRVENIFERWMKALQENENRYRTLVEAQRDTICRWLPDTTLTFVNKAYCEFFGKTRDELLGKSWMALLPKNVRKPVRKKYADLIRNPVVLEYEHQVIAADGTNRWMAWSDVPVFDVNGRLMEYQSVGRDITDHKRLEAEIKTVSETERQRLGRELHDSVGQLLTASGYLANAVKERLVHKSAPEADDMSKLIGYIERAVREVHEIARGLCHDEFKADGLRIMLQELAVVTSDLFDISCRFNGSRAVVLSDAETARQLYRIAQEAVNNAVKHSRGRHIRICLQQNRAGTVLSVSDDGIGIDDRSPRRAEMGLHIMRNRANIIGADLVIESKRGAGTRIKCILPPGGSSLRVI